MFGWVWACLRVFGLLFWCLDKYFGVLKDNRGVSIKIVVFR